MEKQALFGTDSRADRTINLLIVVAMGAILASVYAPMLSWLGRTTIFLEQLHNGGLIVLFALVVSLREAIHGSRPRPEVNLLGSVLVVSGLVLIYLVRLVPDFSLPLILLSFCLSFAGLSAFLFGTAGPRALLPAMAGLLVLGILAGLAPRLDWPLRSLGARFSAAFLHLLGMDVQVVLEGGQPPQILLTVADRVFVVATECNGFGLLASSLLVAAILGLHYHVDWLDKLLLLAVAVPVALLFNALRIVAICVAATHTPLPYVLIHEGIGIVFYSAALVLLWWVAHRRGLPQTKPPPVDDR